MRGDDGRTRGALVAAHNTRLVWAALSANPRRGVRQLARELGPYYVTVYRALHRLHDAGYIQWDRSERGSAWVVLVPFIAGPIRIHTP